jgi:hypothetical protein
LGGVPVFPGQVVAASSISGNLLAYTPAANANGTGGASFTFKVQDNGGTANGGQDTSANAAANSINITAVNDAPSFLRGPDASATDENPATHGPALPTSITGWAKNLSAGPADESSQTLSFTVNNNNNALFSVQPAIDATGKLTFTPAPNAHGSAIVTVTLKDSGGTASGGQDTSVSQTFNINISKPNIWHNSNLWPQANKPGLDVSGGPNNTPDGHVAPNDALAVINYLNAFGSINSGKVPALGSTLPTSPPTTVSYGGPFGYLDVDGDGFVAPVDALTVINAINASQGGEGEDTVASATATSSAVPQDSYFADLGAFPDVAAATAPTPALAATPAPVPSHMDDIIALLAADTADQTLKRRLGQY